jgi:predicted AAA+ superfamily ATPase
MESVKRRWSTRQKGNRIENLCGEEFAKHGYLVFYSRGSRGVDLVCLHESLPQFAVSVGTRGSKRIAAERRLMSEAIVLPTMERLIAVYWPTREVGHSRFRYYLMEGPAFRSVAGVLEALRLGFGR